MGKHKKKHSKKDDVADDILDVAALSVRKYRKLSNEIGKLSAGQKLMGSLGLLAAGYLYLRMQGDDSALSSGHAPLASLLRLGSKAKAEPAPEEEGSTSPKSRKSPKSARGSGIREGR